MSLEKEANQVVMIARCLLRLGGEDRTIFKQLMEIVKGCTIMQLMCDALCYPEGMAAEEPVLNIDGKEIKATAHRPWSEEFDTSYNQRNAVYSTMTAVKVYLESDFEIVGIIGTNLSPKCGRGGEEGDYPFVDAVRMQLSEEGIDIPVIDVQCEDDLEQVRRLFE